MKCIVPVHDVYIDHRLNNESFVNMMSRVKISLLAVDEAHCISQVRFEAYLYCINLM